jgi:cytochrome c-type biogenesis protein CcmH/NrfG
MPEERGQRDAQQRADRLRVFREELAELERQQVLVLTAEQRGNVEPFLDQTLQELARQYDIDVNPSQKQLSWGMRIVSALGGLALCAAVFLFFYRFWGLIPTVG